MQINVVNHPLLQSKMTVLRDANTCSADFRRTIGEVAMLLTFEAAKNIPMEDCKVTTPLCETTGKKNPWYRYCCAYPACRLRLHGRRTDCAS